MTTLEPRVMALGVALGIGLLIGAERERRKGEGTARFPAGVRTFALAGLAGALGMIAGGPMGLFVTVASVAVLAAAGYLRSAGDDPGLTTEVSLVVTALLGGLSVEAAALAAGAAVIVAVLLATRRPLHRFARAGFTDAEAQDALILAGAALVVLPLLPDRPVGPFNALNPHAIWLVVVLVLSIGAAGHVATRLVGERYGLAISGLASGFVSSVATIGALGSRSRHAPALLQGAVAGAILSTVATVIQMAALVGATSLPALEALAPSLVTAGAAAAAYGAVFAVFLRRSEVATSPALPKRAISLAAAVGFAATVAAVLLVSAALRTWYGDLGVTLAAAVAGFADAHAAAISVAALVAEGRLTPAQAAGPILTGFVTNSLSKAVFAIGSGGRPFALRVVPGLVLVALAAWAGLMLPFH